MVVVAFRKEFPEDTHDQSAHRSTLPNAPEGLPLCGEVGRLVGNGVEKVGQPPRFLDRVERQQRNGHKYNCKQQHLHPIAMGRQVEQVHTEEAGRNRANEAECRHDRQPYDALVLPPHH